jgi:hypothetical protein
MLVAAVSAVKLIGLINQEVAIVPTLKIAKKLI